MSQNGQSGSHFAKPIPREPKSAAKLAQIQLHDRRRAYLERNPSYFDNLEHELADPVLYERLVKRFQDAAERDSEVKAKGYGLTLEADLVRGETRLAEVEPSRAIGDVSLEPRKDSMDTDPASTEHAKALVMEQPWDQTASSKEEGQDLWREYLEHRFVAGDDEDFEYEVVDRNDEFDVVARKEAEEKWFDEEEPGWEEDVDHEKPARQGETGVQDY